MNRFYGNGAATSKSSPSARNSNNFGLGLLGVSQYNVVEDNQIAGNVNGVYLGGGGQVFGNTIRRNIIAGNPPAQVVSTFGRAIGADIQDFALVGANSFKENYCLTYAGAGPSPCPNLKPNGDGENRGDDQEGKGEDPPGRFFGLSLFEQAINRVSAMMTPRSRGARAFVNTAFQFDHRPFVFPMFSTRYGDADTGSTVVVVGTVVDAACYMMHPPAATLTSHRDCGAACLARGVPLAIAADDGALYFPADGNQRLKSLLNARVRVSGSVIEKHDPMELKMPVGEKNQMVVRVEGRYRLIEIRTLTKLPGSKRS